MRNDITVAGEDTVTWRFTYNPNGCMTGKTDGTNLTTYGWDENNRLVLVTLPDGTAVAYNYDVMGRMLSRTDTSGTARYEWLGWDMAREISAAGLTTHYLLNGMEILGFQRDNAPYSLHADWLGSVRAVTDRAGVGLASLSYRPWGTCWPMCRVVRPHVSSGRWE